MFNGEDTRTKIFKAALELFSEKGFANTSVGEIVERAGIAKGTIYYHFKGKDELFLMLMESGVEFLTRVIREASAGEHDPVKRLESIIAAQVRLFLNHPDFYKVLMSEIWWLEARLHEDLQKVRKSYLSILEETIRAGQEAGALKPGIDVEMAAPALFGLISHVTLQVVLDSPKPQFHRALRAVTDTFMNGVLMHPRGANGEE